MNFPQPVPGLVIRYSYLWLREHLAGREEGVKDRPCAVILVAVDEGGDQVVTVLPITHAPPSGAMPAVEIPHSVKQKLRLDDDRSWVVLSEVNRFIWPGPDLRPAIPGDSGDVVYGTLPPGFFAELLDRFLKAYDTGRTKNVPRTE